MFRPRPPLLDRLKSLVKALDHWAHLPHDPRRAAQILGGDRYVEEAIEEIERLREETESLRALVKRALPWVGRTPALWPNADISQIRRDMGDEHPDEPAEALHQMALCEQGHVLLRPGVPYIFVEHENCEQCRRLAAVYKDKT